MSPKSTGQSAKLYWRSLDELADTPEFRAFVEKEFPAHAEEMLSGASRRSFLKIMGASIALGGMTACRWPQEEILPFAYRDPGRVPGGPEQYATAMELSGVARGLLVTSYDGRPIKIEGNPRHPESLGAADALSQASILELYDPDRSKMPRSREDGEVLNRTWDDFDAFAAGHFGALKGSGFHVLSEASSSPTLQDLRTRLSVAFPQMIWLEYEPLSRDNERAGASQFFGKPLRPHLHLDQAAVTVSLDADILMTHPAAVKYARDFAGKRRADDGTMNRLYVVESAMSVTGSMADRRYALASADVPLIAAQVAAELFASVTESPLLTAEIRTAIERLASSGPKHAFVASMAADLVRHRGRGLVVAGHRQPPHVHALVHFINALLGNAGTTITYTAEIDSARPSHLDAMRTLAREMKEGKVSTLLILGGNPVYTMPAGFSFASLLAKVPTSIHLSLYDDETSALCRWHLPRAHYLESWGDARAYDGTLTLTQPLIEPLYGGRTETELLAAILGEPVVKGYDLVRRTFAQAGEQDFEKRWRRALHDGFVADSGFPVDPAAPDLVATLAALEGAPSGTRPAEGSLEIVFTQDHSVYDGRFANNGWLQELPDPITKLTWDNALLVAQPTAQAAGIAHGDIVRIESKGATIEAPAYVMPGQARDSVAIALGYGRTRAGRVGNGPGFAAYGLRTTDAMDVASGARLVKTGRVYKLATTQDHHAIDEVGFRERGIRIQSLVRQATLAEYKESPEFVEERAETPPLFSLWKEHAYEGQKWAMAIDLSACTGCSACVVACQAENNIPVVGKDQVARGREMHWIRVDRYFSGEPEAPDVSYQPVACQQCENAPCEQVCPVGATQHSHEGLNDMVYNRCIGTRYCSNNCPYKVRRFNWFNNHKDTSQIEKMVYNPEVTVRSRGVMEKCTFCIQRISAVRIAAKNERRPIHDGEITPACAQTCPTQAIVFGDLNDPTSRVRKLHEHKRSYAMLGELNVKPRTKYLAKLRNPAEEQT